MEPIEKVKQIKIYVYENFHYYKEDMNNLCIMICEEIILDLKGKFNDWSFLRNNCDMTLLYWNEVLKELKK